MSMPLTSFLAGVESKEAAPFRSLPASLREIGMRLTRWDRRGRVRFFDLAFSSIYAAVGVRRVLSLSPGFFVFARYAGSELRNALIFSPAMRSSVYARALDPRIVTAEIDVGSNSSGDATSISIAGKALTPGLVRSVTLSLTLNASHCV